MVDAEKCAFAFCSVLNYSRVRALILQLLWKSQRRGFFVPTNEIPFQSFPGVQTFIEAFLQQLQIRNSKALELGDFSSSKLLEIRTHTRVYSPQYKQIRLTKIIESNKNIE